jgi:hypothetical protein
VADKLSKTGFVEKTDEEPEPDPRLAAAFEQKRAQETREAFDQLIQNQEVREASAPELVSPSVAELIRANKVPVDAAALVTDLLKSHSAYASGRPRDRLMVDLEAFRGGRRNTAAAWITAARALFASNFVEGRRAIVALAVLEPALRRILDRHGFVDALANEAAAEERTHKKSKDPAIFADLLTPEARRAWNLARLGEDAVQTRSDAPADQDKLFRWPFAEGLALRIRSMREADRKKRPLMLLLDGPWGSGKSTVMHFVSKLLEDPRIREDGEIDRSGPRPGRKDHWITVRFNAWQHQRLDAPWWSLTSALIDQAVRAEFGPHGSWIRGTRVAARHVAFRLLSGRVAFLVGAVLVTLVGLALYKPPGDAGKLLEFWKNLIAVLTVVFAVGVGLTRALSGTDKSSQEFLASRPDPMRSLETHICACLKDLDRHVIVLVDDIDRCDAAAVVKLLEGMQVLFGEAPVVFLVAGDQRWVQRSFEKIYETFSQAVGDATRPLGASFLEKTFQIAVWLPEPIEEGRAMYWRDLLGLKTDLAQAAAPSAAELQTEAEIVNVGRRVEGDGDVASRLQFRREANQRLATQTLSGDIETHTLAPIYKFIEPNPRAMKRLVMAYGLARSVDILSGRYSPSGALALWTVLGLRWPELAAWLRESPDRLARTTVDISDDASERDNRLTTLLLSPAVKRVLEGPTGAGLTVATLSEIVGIAD